MVTQEVNLRDKATELIEQWHKSDGEAAVARDQPDTACLQVMARSIGKAVTKWWIKVSNTVAALICETLLWLMLLEGSLPPQGGGPLRKLI